MKALFVTQYRNSNITNKSDRTLLTLKTKVCYVYSILHIVNIILSQEGCKFKNLINSSLTTKHLVNHSNNYFIKENLVQDSSNPLRMVLKKELS